MNYFWVNNLKAIVWKESIEALRRNTLYIPFLIGLTIFMQYIPVAQIVNDKTISNLQKSVCLGIIPIYIPFMIIPMLGTTILSRSLFEERIVKSLQVLLASGVSQKTLWFGKYLVAFIYTYITTILTFIAYFLFVKLYIGQDLIITKQTILAALVTIPIAANGVLAFVATSYWAFKNSQLVTIVFPLLSLFGTWNFTSSFGTKYSLTMVTLITLLAGVVFIVLSVFLVGRISKEKITEI
jgi:ABC-type transport system involved in multi-copper enzyme maturation permease subunit